MDWKKILNISIFKTIWFNYKYFGPFSPLYVLIAKNTKLELCSGTVVLATGNKRIGMIQIGFNSTGHTDKKYQRCIWENSGKIVFHGITVLGAGTRIVCMNNALLEIGGGATINANSSIICGNHIVLGTDTLISWECLIMDTDFHKIYDSNGQILNNPKSIIIGNGSWIGCRTTILKGSIIPEQSIIGACSTISKELAFPNSIYVNTGNILKKDVFWSH